MSRKNRRRNMTAIASNTPSNETPRLPDGNIRTTSSETLKSKSAEKLAANKADNDYLDCLSQADICREQAQNAARLKRFKAARGLFATAIALCRRAAKLRRTRQPQTEAVEANERLAQLNVEMLTYSELAKSMEKPLLSRHSDSLSLSKTDAARSSATPHTP